MGKKRKAEAIDVEAEKTLYTSFVAAANAVSGLYTQVRTCQSALTDEVNITQQGNCCLRLPPWLCALCVLTLQTLASAVQGWSFCML